MTEEPVLFGPECALVGVLTQPPRSAATGVAILMFNAGVLPRIGPHRLNVKLARALAGAGATSLRFDLSGRGDSRSAGAAADPATQAVHDIRCAMDYLESRCGIRRFIVIGICSGAVDAFAAARADARVVGALMFDGHWYRSPWTLPVRHWKRFRRGSWSAAVAAIRRRVARLGGRRADPATGALEARRTPASQPSRAEFVAALNELVERRVAVFLLYSGSVIDYYSYAGQFRHVFAKEAFFGKVRCDFRPDIDHTFVSLQAQKAMIDLVRDWTTGLPGAGPQPA